MKTIKSINQFISINADMKKIYFIFSIIIFLMPIISNSTIITVGSSGNYQKIQEAIDASKDGDEIIVSPGKYIENVKFNGKNIILRSEDPTNTETVAQTIIDGNNTKSCVTFSGDEQSSCLLAGFTLINGRGINGGGICGGSASADTHAVIQNNIISNCIASSYFGGGIYKCDGRIQNNIIFGNSAKNGGGLYDCDGIIQNNTIANNSALSGGGINYCNGVISNCIIWENVALIGSQITESKMPTYSCIQGWRLEGSGNILYNPRFIDPVTGNYRLSEKSKCIDAGCKVDIDKDIEGNNRPTKSVLWETRGDGSGYDIGAFEYNKIVQQQVLTNPSILYVPSDNYPIIQDALDAAIDGCEIIVSPGIYNENLFIDGKNVILRSTNPKDKNIVDNTIIDGKNKYSTVSFRGTELDTCVLSGFTIIYGSETQYGGGGINGGFIYDTKATIENNVIKNNYARDGAGIYKCDGLIQNNTIFQNSAFSYGGGLRDCHGTIQNNLISKNTADNSGGGIYLCSGSIKNNKIIENTSKLDGGGIYNCQGTIFNNTIIGNSSTSANGGGLAFCNGDKLNNIIMKNVAYYYGGGIYRCNGAILYNIIKQNSANDGGGIYEGDGTIQNNIIAENSAIDGGGLHGCNGVIYNNTIVKNAATWGGGFYISHGIIMNCIIWQNSATYDPNLHSSSTPSYSCINNWSGGGTGNISLDPEFVNITDGDYHLSDNSPCIDTGNPEEQYNDKCIPPGKKTSLNDMGAYGGPLNCGWFLYSQLKDFLLGKTEDISGLDFNGDGIVDVADVVYYINLFSKD